MGKIDSFFKNFTLKKGIAVFAALLVFVLIIEIVPMIAEHSKRQDLIKIIEEPVTRLVDYINADEKPAVSFSFCEKSRTLDGFDESLDGFMDFIEGKITAYELEYCFDSGLISSDGTKLRSGDFFVLLDNVQTDAGKSYEIRFAYIFSEKKEQEGITELQAAYADWSNALTVGECRDIQQQSSLDDIRRYFDNFGSVRKSIKLE